MSNEQLNEWLGVLLWLAVVSLTKIASASKDKKLTTAEMVSEVAHAFFGGIFAYLSIRAYKDFQWKWAVITGGAAAGAELMKFFTLNVKAGLRTVGKKVQSKVDNIDNLEK